MTVAATIAICTWNRADLLDQTLGRLRALRIPVGLAWEVVVVNNGSTDETDAVIHRHSASLPVRRVLQPQQGLSHARNAALQAAAGELILWTDDDVLVDPQWLAEHDVRLGRSGRWIPTARVQHFLPRERLTLDYLRAFYQGIGQTECRQQSATSSSLPIPRWTVRKTQFQLACQSLACAGLSAIPGWRGKAWARALIRANVSRGRLAGWQTA